MPRDGPDRAAGEFPGSLAAPILLRLTSNRRCRRVLDLEPMVDPAGAVRRTEPLRDDALAAERAGMFEEDCASTVVVLIEGDTLMGAVQASPGWPCAPRPAPAASLYHRVRVGRRRRTRRRGRAAKS